MNLAIAPAALLDGDPPASREELERLSLPVKATKGNKGGATGGKTRAKAGGAELQALEQRLERLEHVVLLIAQQVGVPQEAIAQLATHGSPPPS